MTSDDNHTILYVDDEEMNLFIFEKCFESNYKVLTAKSGEEGLTKLETLAEQIMVVISDMNMPNMNGVEFVTEAKNKYPDITYFILTGYEYNDEINEAINNNIVKKFFKKPFDVPEIDIAIDSIAKSIN
jgi:response regulator RpfG family c-di-GMP phosphodiesterase